MFEQAVLSSGPAAKRVWTTSLGLVGQGLVVAGVVLLTVVFPQALPVATILTRLEAPGPPPGPIPPGPQVRQHGPKSTIPFRPSQLIQPSGYIPPVAATIVDPPPETDGGGSQPCIGCVPGGVQGSVPLFGDPVRPPAVVSRQPDPVRAVVAVKTPTPEPTRIVRISTLEPARLIHKVEPVYPEMAKRIRVQGTVQIEAIVATDGHMRDLRAVSGNPLLIPAAIEAVRQWIYQPTVLNGEKVEVSAPITVNFRLN